MLKEFIEHIQKTTQPLITNVNGSAFCVTSDGTIKHYGVPLCAACAQKRKEAASAAETQQEAETAAEMQQELDPERIQVDPETGEVL